MAEIGAYYITVLPSMNSFTKNVKQALGDAGSSGASTFNNGFLDTLKGSAIGTVLGNIASKAGDAIFGGLDTGIKRIDTIQNFPKVMESLGYTTDEADQSIRTIMDHLDGLPTSTQDMVSLTQALSDSTGDLDLATRAALGFNDMMLANGASAAEMSTAQGVLNRVLGKGSATAAQWQSLCSVMPAQLNLVAKSLLGPTANSETLHAALEDGTLSWKDFLQAIADLDKSGYVDEAGNKIASFEEQARANSHGIGTAIDNVKNRIGAGWAAILEVIGREDIAGTIDKISYGIRESMKKIAEAIGEFKDSQLGGVLKDAFQFVLDHGETIAKLLLGIGTALLFKEAAGTTVKFLSGVKDNLKDLFGLLEAGDTVGDLAEAFKAVATEGGPLSGLFTALSGGLEGLGGVFGGIALGPAAAIAAAIGIIAGVIKTLWDNNETFRNAVMGIWEEIQNKFGEAGEKIGQAFEAIGAALQPVGSALSEVWNGFCDVMAPLILAALHGIADVIEGFVDIVSGIFEVIGGIIEGFRTGDWTMFTNGIMDIWKGIWEVFTAPAKAVFDTITDYLKSFGKTWDDVWKGVSKFFDDTWKAIQGMFDDNKKKWDEWTQNLRNANEELKKKITEAWDNICKDVTTTVENIGKGLQDNWRITTEQIQKWNEDTKRDISEKWEEIKTNVGNAVEGIKNGIKEKWDAITSTVSQAVEGVKSAVSEKFNAAKDAALGIFDGIKEGIREKIQWAKDRVSEIVEGIKNLFNFNWSLPAPQLPQINWHWQDIGGVVSIPMFDGISWAAKGGIFDGPTIIGVGEAGREAALPLNRQTYGEIAHGIANEMGGGAGVLVTGNTFVVRDEYDIDLIADRINRKIARERGAVA